jgi:hypothetical protein
VRSRKYTTNHANSGTNYGILILSLVVTITFGFVFFKLVPERTIWSIPIKPEEEHMLAVPASGGFSGTLIQKGTEEHTPTTKEEYKNQYHGRRRVLIVDDEPDITSSFKEALRDKGFEVI